jgi:hypothetical protein
MFATLAAIRVFSARWAGCVKLEILPVMSAARLSGARATHGTVMVRAEPS